VPYEPPPPSDYRNFALDVLALPTVALAPRKSVVTFGARLPLHYGFRRWAWRSERCLEVALAQRVLAGRDPADVLEVGNVLALAGIAGHVVVDKYERAPGVTNTDILGYSPGRRFGLGVSISTLEHVGWDERPPNPDKAARALSHLSDLVDALLVTVPVGYHREFEPAMIDGPFDAVELFVKTSRRAGWEPRPLADAQRIAYGQPYEFANGLLVGARKPTGASR
jgi:hypothetical protein